MSSQSLKTVVLRVCLVISSWKISEAVFTFQCPVQSHWKHRSEAICDSFDKYFCLYDRNEKKYNESCRDRPDIEKPGYKLIVAGSLEGDPCEHEFYQPFKFSSIGNSRCVYKQSYCSEEGQLVYRNGTEKIVRSCRCDYTRGFDFITRPKNPCLCVPSSEDCSCYHKTCPNKYILSPDYECLNENEWKLNFHCDSIATVVLSKDSGISLSTDNFGYHVKAYGMSACVAVLVMLVIMLSVLVIILGLPVLQDCFYRMKRKRTDLDTISIQDVEEKIASIIANEQSSLEKQIEANDYEKHKLKEEINKLRDNIGHVPHHVQELQKEILQHWSNVLNKFVLTKAAQVLYQHIQTENVIAIIGPTGTSKSTYAYHIAFRLKNEYNYSIVPTRQPSDILQYHVSGTYQVFIIDDFIGKYAFDDTEAVSWEKEGPLIDKILSHKERTKVILTCRKSVWHREKCERFGFSAYLFDLESDELRLTLSETRTILEAYVEKSRVVQLNDQMIMMYTFLPSLCSIFSSITVADIERFFTVPVQFLEDEINNYKIKSTLTYMSLAVLAIEQKVTKWSSFDNLENEELIKHLFRESGFQMLPSKKNITSHLEALTNTYVKIDNDCFEFIHETMQNIVLYCISKTFINSVLKFCKPDVFKNQVRLAFIMDEHTLPVIKVKSELENAYFTRVMEDLRKGLYMDVFENNQNAFETFRKKFCIHVNKHKQEINLKVNSDGMNILHVVSLFGYTEFASLFLNIDKRMIHVSDRNGNTPLHLAATNGYTNIVKLLVEAGRNVHLLNNDKLSPFFYACENNSIPVVNYLIDLEGDPVKINETYMLREYKSVLHIACSKGFGRLTKILLDNHASINIQDTSGFTPLHLTCLNGHYEIALQLLEKGANVNVLDILDQTPVFYACTGNYKNIVELLIKYKTDINQISSTGLLPLHVACEKADIEIVNTLLKNLSNVNVKGKTVESPLHIACRRGNERIVTLINHSASVNSKTVNMLTPLHVACANGHLNVANILLSQDAKYNTRNTKGWTALFFSCENGNNDLVKIILNLTREVNITDKAGVTPLMVACKGSHFNVVETLLVANADVTQCDNDKCSPLVYACTAGNVDIVNILLGHGAFINLANKSGITPLHAACMNKHEQVIKALIEKGADVN